MTALLHRLYLRLFGIRCDDCRTWSTHPEEHRDLEHAGDDS